MLPHTRSTRRGGLMRTLSRAGLKDRRFNSGSHRLKCSAAVKCQMETHSPPQLPTITRPLLQSERVQLAQQCSKVKLFKTLSRRKRWSIRKKSVELSLNKTCQLSPTNRRLVYRLKAHRLCHDFRLSLSNVSEKS